MISIVCVYNNEEILKKVLLKSLQNQTVKFELIALDNRENKFKSAAEALNYGGERANGDYLMFIHQDMWLGSKTWLEDTENILVAILDLGIAGVAGQSEKGKTWEERCRCAIEVFGEMSEISRPVRKLEEVQTLDECLLIVPRSVFNRLKFDEKLFDGWDSYGADYCLSVRQLGLRAYVIPAYSSHSCSRMKGYGIWEFKDLLKYQKRLYDKHEKNNKTIYTWMGKVSWLDLRIGEIKQFLEPIYFKLFPDSYIFLEKELRGCNSILDLGCGYHSPISRFNISHSVGVEMFEPYLQETQRKAIHSEYIKADIRRIAFKPKSFDAVLAMEVLEHLTKQEGLELLSKMESWARKRVIVTTPNGHMKQNVYDENTLQEHMSGWKTVEFKKLGFRVFGSAGWKKLRGEKASLKYKPILFWSVVSNLTQKITFRYPNLAFQLLAIKRIEESDNN